MTVYVCGDLHGSLGNIRNAMGQIQEPRENDVIIVAGDAGLEYGDIVNSSCKKQMKKFPGSWLIMRGNHDARYMKKHQDHTNWEIISKWDNVVIRQKKYPNIYYISDCGGLYNVEDNNILFIPGAYSVDKNYRLTMNKPYEPEEQLTREEWEYLGVVVDNYLDSIDYVIAHTYPKDLEPLMEDLFLSFIEQSSVDKTTEINIHMLMKEIEKGQRFKHYFFGHMHDDRDVYKNYTMIYRKLINLEDYNG